MIDLRERLWVFLLFAGLAAGALLSLAFTRMLFQYALPSNETMVGSLSSFPPSQHPYLLRSNQGLFFLVNNGEDILALSNRTPHQIFLPCKLRWDAERQSFSDPCGGSHFNLDGSYQMGPALRDMFRHPIRFVDGKVWVDVSRAIEGKAHE